MKYDDKYPNAVFHDEPEPLVVKLSTTSCWHCKCITNWWHLFFEMPLCSEECFKFEYEEFIKVYNK